MKRAFLPAMLLAFFLCGWVTTAKGKSLPNFLVGSWVSSDFKTRSADAEPYSGFALYLLPDGRAAWLAAPEVGALCTASYSALAHVVTVRDVLPDERGPRTRYEFRYDPTSQTLTIYKITPQPEGEKPEDHRKDKKDRLTRRTTEIPAFIRKEFKSHGKS